MRPEPSSRHPVIVAFFIMATVAGAAGLFFKRPPNSIEASLVHPVAIFIWNAALFFGGLAVLTALALQHPERSQRRFGVGVSFEQVGMAMTGSAAILYAVAAYKAVGPSGAFPAGMILVFGVGCLYREGSILRQIWKATKALKAEGADTDGER